MSPLLPESGTLHATAAQFAAGPNVADNLDRIGALCARAAEDGAQLVVFPEASMFDWHADAEQIAQAASEHGDMFAERLGELAATHALTLVVGAFVVDAEGQIRNRMLAYGPQGELLAYYDKIHLYDAFHYRESDKIEPARPDASGSELAVIPFGDFTLGLLNCYDLRFPEISRALIDAGADTLVVSSAWVDGEHKTMHWQSLLRARAIENTCYVVASNQPGPLSVGSSMIFDPMGLELAQLPDGDGLAGAELSTRRLAEVRDIVPSLQHRQYRVVAGSPAASSHLV